MRARYITKDIIFDSRMGEMSMSARVLAYSLPCLADREGRLILNLDEIRAKLFPFDFDVDLGELIEELCRLGWLETYSAEVNSKSLPLIQICDWEARYHISAQEKQNRNASELPPSDGAQLPLLPSLNSTQRRVIQDNSLSVEWLVNTYNQYLGHMRKANLKQTPATRDQIRKKHKELEREYRSLGVTPEEYWDGVFASCAANEFFCDWFRGSKGASFRWFFGKSNAKLTEKFEARPEAEIEQICSVCRGKGRVKTQDGWEDCWRCNKSKKSA